MKRLTMALRERQAEVVKLNAATYLRRGFGRQVAANLPACRSLGEGRKEFGDEG